MCGGNVIGLHERFLRNLPVGRNADRLSRSSASERRSQLGGKSAKIVLDDVPNFAQEIAASMLVHHAGQGCAVQSRILVSRKRYAEAAEILRQAYAAYESNWGVVDDPSQVM